MTEESHSPGPGSPGPGWRIPKACEECRKRKIRCNGLNPCKTCERRDTPCVYRSFIRHRKRKHEYQDDNLKDRTRLVPSASPQPSRQWSSSIMKNFPNSVSATHMASPSCPMQLYYGATSHFALMQHIYRDLVSNSTAHPHPSGGVDEAGAGLELFSFRRIFFGTPDTHETGRSGPGDLPVMFLPYETAKMFLSRFLSSLYNMMPFRPRAFFENSLLRLYNPSPSSHPDTLSQATILLALATSSLGTEYYAWGDILYERVKALLRSYDDVGRPNSAFLQLGSAARKALAAGLHKEVPYGEVQTPEMVEARRITFWSLYLFETSLALKDVAIEYSRDPFVRVLVHLCKTISRSTEEIYGQHHESLLHMWRVARSIHKDLRDHEFFTRQTLGFGLDSAIQTGSIGVQQTIFTTLYYHTLLLTFRPFLIFRGHLQRERKLAAQQAGGRPSSHPAEIPPWLNEACHHVINAAQKTIHHLSEASRLNDLVRELRYHGYFLSSSAFTLIYDLVHDPNAASSYLPWVYASLQTLSTMREGDPITSSITAIQTTLQKINPSYEWSSGRKHGESYTQTLGTSSRAPPHTFANDSSPTFNGLGFQQSSAPGLSSGVPSSHLSFPQIEGPETGHSGGSTEDLLDFTQSDMGWDFDFSTMDLEAFFSVYQPTDPPLVPGGGFP
ncbi:hypothetical protein N7478_007369 [Penicillium angulare]|uniref:uncharacterized protein n=1 Tax=Penicillium angulare TaxID=116970 RepID=UPI00254009AA|nr:uncharacterized protein N7478_007369 [Penicillium angulare]KAJ5281997.1 hypothetical protein N7478_007369 [Penicillium angulare]